jgi:tetratricopeptide (TPR) repeat protein
MGLFDFLFGKKIQPSNKSELASEFLNAVSHNEYGKAISLFQNEWGDDYEKLSYLSHCYFGIKDFEKGEKVGLRALAKSPKANIFKDKIRFFICVGMYNNGQYNLAIKYGQEIVDFGDKEGIGETKKLPLVMGKSFSQIDKFEIALEWFLKAPVKSKYIDNELQEILFCIGKCYEVLKKPKQALSYYNKVYAVNIHREGLEEKISNLQKNKE